jgi:type I restriction enzyme S subunit
MTGVHPWPILPLERLAVSVDYGLTASAIPIGDGPKFLRITDIQDGEVDWHSVPTCLCPAADRQTYSLRPGDIVFARTGATTGKSFLIRSCPPEAVFASYLIRVRPDACVDPAYLACYFQTPYYWQQVSRASAGTAQAGVNASKLKALKIPLPPLLDQKRIATILDKADAIRRKRQASIRLADDFLRSVFLDMFGDPVTNPKGWPMVKLSEIGQLDRGVSKHRPRNAPELLGGTFPLIQTGDIANSGGYIRDFTQTYSETGLRQSKIWPVGTLCITIAANIAKTGILTFDACFPDSVVGFIPYSDQTTTEFAQWWLSFLQEGLEESAPESAQKNINLKILRDLDVVCPPFSQQCQFSQIVRRARKHAENTAASTRAANDLFQSLSHRAFAGEL